MSKLLSFAAAAALLVIAQVSQATVVVNDDFTNGITATPGTAEVGFVAVDTNNTVSAASGPGNGGLSGPVLQYTTTANNRSALGAFQSNAELGNTSLVSLATVGNSISLSFDFSLAAGFPSTNFGLRVGLVDSTLNGYGIGLNPGITATTAGAGNVSVFTAGATSTLAGSGFSQTAPGTSTHSVSFTLTRTATGLSIAASSADGLFTSFTRSIDTPVTTEFSQIVVRYGAINASNTTPMTTYFDNLVVNATVPEPGMLGVAGLAVAALLRRRSK